MVSCLFLLIFIFFISFNVQDETCICEGDINDYLRIDYEFDVYHLLHPKEFNPFGQLNFKIKNNFEKVVKSLTSHKFIDKIKFDEDDENAYAALHPGATAYQISESVLDVNRLQASLTPISISPSNLNFESDAPTLSSFNDSRQEKTLPTLDTVTPIQKAHNEANV